MEMGPDVDQEGLDFYRMIAECNINKPCWKV